MHIPLLINPGKPKRSAGSRCATASVLFGLCAAIVLFGEQDSEQHTFCPNPSPILAQKLVKYMTVMTSTLEIKGQDGIVYMNTHQVPLMELYAELCKREIEAKHHAGTSWGAEAYSLRTDKEFAEKYGLTLEQIGMIKREGDRAKHGIGE